jgi:hypothetical protein
MLNRLGKVVYGFGIIVAVGFFAFGFYISASPGGIGLAKGIPLAGVFAMIPFSIGWSCRYVLCGVQK